MPRKPKDPRNHHLVEKYPGVWYVRFRTPGKKDRWLKGGSVTAARRLRDRLLEERSLQKAGLISIRATHENLTLRELIERYEVEFEHLKGARNSRRYAEVWKRDLGHLPAKEVTPYDVLQWQKAQGLLGLSGATINRYTAFLRRVFSLAVRDMLLEVNPAGSGRVPSKKEKGRRERVITRDEEQVICAALEPLDMAAFVLCLYSGMRQGEALNLKREHICFETSSALLTETKAGEEQRAPLSSAALDAVSFAMSLHSSDFIFPGKSLDAPMSGSRLTRRLKKACSELPPGIVWHSTRHTFVTRLTRAGVDVDLVRASARHSTIAVTNQYMHTSMDLARDAMEALCPERSLFPSAPSRRGHLKVLEGGSAAGNVANL